MEYSPFGENGKIIVSAPVPYPPLTVDGPNPQIARLLGVDLASSKSEMTSICQYLYHSWVLPSTADSADSLLKRIAEVEMHHYDMLGQLIVKLGGDPKYVAVQNRPLPWDARMVSYTRTPASAFRDDLMLEQAAIETYRRQAAAISDPHVVAVIRRILLDEEMHLLIFRRLLSETSIGSRQR